MSSELLQKELDKAAISLLQKVATDGTDVSEQAKAFSAAVEWFKIRSNNAPPDAPKESKFGAIKQQFHGSTPERARGRGRPKKDRGGDADSESGAGSDDPPAGPDGSDSA